MKGLVNEWCNFIPYSIVRTKISIINGHHIYIDIRKVIDTQSQSQLRWIGIEIFIAHVLIQHGGYQTNAAAVYTLLDD